jgi:hypothetical protein
MNSASWVICDRATGAVLFETFDRATAMKIDQEKFEAVPVREHLHRLNMKIKAGEA